VYLAALVMAGVHSRGRDRLKKLFNPGKPMMVHVRAIRSKIKGGARDISK
jgi:hypothetical protein